MAVEQDAAAASTTLFSDALGLLNSNWTQSIPLIGAFLPSLTALPAIATLAALGVVALADAIGTLIAIVADLVAPVALVTGLLGGLAAAFFIAAKSAFGGQGALGGQVSVLKNQFDNLTKTLVNDFMPVFKFLIDNAHSALTYLNQIAKLPLAQAFKSLATTGVQAVTKFLGQIGSLLARPFRLAVQIAFGTGKGGNEVSSAVSALWKQFTDFFLGYTKTHPVRVGGKFLGITTTQVDGALQPFLDWFNRHNFTAQGTKIGHQLLNGLKPLARPMGQFLVTVFEDAFKTVLSNFYHFLSTMQSRNRAIAVALGKDLLSLLGRAWDAVVRVAEQAWSSIGAKGRAAVITLVAVIGGPLVFAFGSVKAVIGDILSTINSVIGAVRSLIGMLQSAASAASALSLGSGSLGGAAGRQARGGPPAKSGPPVGHVMVNHFHFHGASDRASFSRFAREIGRELGRQQHILAGGQ